MSWSRPIYDAKVPEEMNEFDIYVALSRLDSESFGVAVLEAGAAGLPVVVSDAGGLPEVTLDGVTGVVVPRENAQAASEAIEKLVYDPELRLRMGQAARDHVKRHYSWDVCVSTMTDLYASVIKSQR
ncbi:glycosyltransferase [Halomonas lysinitropha]|uniref:glycosyltransferase n=1 Tax=Halomonas lysinitropha TaxID=2607506 RepID=UPI001CEC8A10|nr:glycosyltransferase family 4 protein [Halomonas lysinitropha]